MNRQRPEEELVEQAAEALSPLRAMITCADDSCREITEVIQALLDKAECDIASAIRSSAPDFCVVKFEKDENGKVVSASLISKT